MAQGTKRVQVASETYYLTADRSRAVRRGDPSAFQLLVRRGSPIDPDVAEFYSVETEDAEGVTAVPTGVAASVPDDIRLRGVAPETARGYEQMRAEAEVREELKGVPRDASHNPGSSAQVAMMAQGMAAERSGIPPNTVAPLAPAGMGHTLLTSSGAPEGSEEDKKFIDSGGAGKPMRGATEGGTTPTPPGGYAPDERAIGGATEGGGTGGSSLSETGAAISEAPAATPAGAAESAPARASSRTVSVGGGAKGGAKGASKGGAKGAAKSGR